MTVCPAITFAHGLQGVAFSLGDVLIAVRDRHECTERAENVLQKLRDHGIGVNRDRCPFFPTAPTLKERA